MNAMHLFTFKKLLILGIVCGLLFTNLDAARQQHPSLEPIRVGVFLDLSGRTSSYGTATLNGVKLAADEINAYRGTDRRRVELHIEDDSGRPDEAATVARRLIDQKKVHALVGEVASSNTLAAAPIAQNAKVPLITSATHLAITQVGNYVFRVGVVDPFQAQALAQFAIRTLKVKRVALLVDATSDYSQDLAAAFEKSLTGLGGLIVLKQSYAGGDKDFAAQLVAIKRSNPDVVFIPGYYSEAGPIARQAKQLGLTKPLLGCDGWDSPQLWELGGNALNGAYIANHYAVDNPSSANKEFVSKYKARYESAEPDSLAALGYDAMKLLADAVSRAGTIDGPSLQRALAETRGFEGVTGTITMDENRNPLRAVILRLQDGKFLYRATVLPTKANGRN